VTSLTMYSRPGCHLCDEMKSIIERVGSRIALTLEVVDISADVELEKRYGLEIPVLLVEGRKAAKYRVSEEQLLRLVQTGHAEAS
jgi:glutaredoxin